MSTYTETLKLKLAWQAAFELRTCPDSDTLHVSEPDEHLKKHLAICHVCREKREMNTNERNAWKFMKDKFADITMKPGAGTEKQPGQIWTLKRELGAWREDGRFIKPPTVLLLEKIEGTSGWRVVQLYHDRLMMGDGDVALDERYGFAETWNCYSLKGDRLDKCLGTVKTEQLQQVLSASVTAFEPAPAGSILSFFRTMEIEVGSFMAVPAVAELMEEWEGAKEEVFELVPGLKLALDGAKGFVMDIAADTLDLLRSTFRPSLVLRGAATKPALPKLSDEQKKLIQEHCPVVPIEVKILEDTLMVTLKWIIGKPVDLPIFRIILNGAELSGYELNDTGRNMVIITCNNDLISNKSIQNVQLAECGKNITITIYC